jgi:hypothetical protein
MKVVAPGRSDRLDHPDAEALIEEARQRQHKRRLLIGSIVLVVVVAAAVWAASYGGSAIRPPRGASNGASPIKPPSSSKKPSHAKSGASAASTTIPYVAASPIACGSDFFDAADSAFLTKWFGVRQTCLRASNSNVWIDVVSGGAVSGPGPGGSVVLVGRCESRATKCLDANASHSLADFRAYPSPAPSGNLQFYNLVIVPGTGVGAGCSSDCALPAQAGQLPVFSTGGCSVTYSTW